MSLCFSSTSLLDWWNGGKRTNSYFALSITHKLVENKANNIKHKANLKNKNDLLKQFITTQTKTVKLSFSELTSIKVSLIWSSGFGILKQNPANFGIESIRASYNARNNPRDYGIARNLGSGKTGLKNPIGNPLLILQQTELFYEENVWNEIIVFTLISCFHGKFNSVSLSFQSVVIVFK